MLLIRHPLSIFVFLSTKVLFRSPQMIIEPSFKASKLANLVGLLSKFSFGVRNSRIWMSQCGGLCYPKSSFSLATIENAMNSMPSVIDSGNVKLLNQSEAVLLDQELFTEYKFSVDQLMELAGLSVATAIAQVYNSKTLEKVVVVAGPGNNGGDGLVVARHLKQFGFRNVTILNARKPTKDLYINLLHQASQNDVEISYTPDAFRQDNSANLVVDALFGFSFKPPVRPEFVPFLDVITSAHGKSIPVVAVDIPSGWDVESGPSPNSYMPEMLVSLTAPKVCATYFNGSYHFIGGRFVPRKLSEKYSLNLPPYSGTECIVRIK